MRDRNGGTPDDGEVNPGSFGARKWIRRGFVILVGYVIAYCVTQTKEIGMILEDHIDMEDLNAPQARVVSKSEERFLEQGGLKLDEFKTLFRKSEDLKQPMLGVSDKTTITKQDETQTNPTPNNAIEEKKSNILSYDERLNIVLFYADDWTMKVLGKLDPTVKTPNIDKMADQGMLFLNNCVTTSVCWISRATLMTGTYYARHLQNNPSSEQIFKTHAWNETLFPKLKSAGYYTGLFGKWHAPQPQEEMKQAFHKREMYYGKHWMTGKDGKPQHVTDKNREHAISFLENRPRNKKFALKVSFFATHAEDNNIPSYKPMNWSRMELYPDNSTHQNYQTIVPPKTATHQHWTELPYFFVDGNTGRGRWKQRWEPDVWQKNIRDLFAMATEVDWAVGEIINVLKEQGVYNNTLLVFTTDNGDLHGEHGLAEKWYPMEESMKVPLIIQDPRMPSKHRGSMNSDWTLNVDLAPTLLGAAGLEPASFMQGRDVAQLYLANETKTAQEEHPQFRNNIARYDTLDAKQSWRHEWFYEWNMGEPITALKHEFDGWIDAAFALITNEWKYIYWPLKVYEQLFHRSLDKYDEYDILQNYYLHRQKVAANQWVDQDERLRMETFTPQNTTPFGDSVESTKEIYETMKQRYEILKKHVQSGGKI